MASKWYYRVGDERLGPVESKALKLLAEVGQITPHTLVQKEGASSWAEASRVKGLFTPQKETIDQAPPVLSQDQQQQPEVPMATEYAHRVSPASQVPVADRVPEAPPIVAPAVVTHSEPGEKRQDFLEHKRRRSSAMPLLFTIVGVLVVSGAGVFLYVTFGKNAEQSIASGTIVTADSSSSAPAPPSPEDNISKEQEVFLGIRSFSDASNSRTRLADGKIQLKIAEVWFTQSEKTVDGVVQPPEYTMNVLLEMENLDATNAYTLNRQSVVSSDSDALDPYTPLARNGSDEIVSPQEQLQSATIPAGGKISETLSFVLASDQINDFRLALPLAWFRKSGYTGYSIPNVMVAGSPGSSANIARSNTDQQPTSDSESTPAPDGTDINQAATVKPAASPDTESVEKEKSGNGQLPPPPDFGIPNKPEGENGDQPDDIKSLQDSIKASVKQEPADQPQESDPGKPAEPDDADAPKFK